MHFNHLTRRIANQRRRFILFGWSAAWLAEKIDNDMNVISQIIISAEHISEIKNELREVGITESLIYPDLDGVGNEIKQRWDMWNESHP